MIMKVGTVAIKMTQLLVTGCEGGGVLWKCARGSESHVNGHLGI